MCNGVWAVRCARACAAGLLVHRKGPCEGLGCLTFDRDQSINARCRSRPPDQPLARRGRARAPAAALLAPAAVGRLRAARRAPATRLALPCAVLDVIVTLLFVRAAAQRSSAPRRRKGRLPLAPHARARAVLEVPRALRAVHGAVARGAVARQAEHRLLGAASRRTQPRLDVEAPRRRVRAAEARDPLIRPPERRLPPAPVGVLPGSRPARELTAAPSAAPDGCGAVRGMGHNLASLLRRGPAPAELGAPSVRRRPDPPSRPSLCGGAGGPPRLSPPLQNPLRCRALPPRPARGSAQA